MFSEIVNEWGRFNTLSIFTWCNTSILITLSFQYFIGIKKQVALTNVCNANGIHKLIKESSHTTKPLEYRYALGTNMEGEQFDQECWDVFCH